MLFRSHLLAEADAVVLASAGEALALWSNAHTSGGIRAAADDTWIPALASTRGQVSIVAADTPGLRPPALPIAGSGYALTLPDGSVMCGATTSPDDDDPAVRLVDHAHNLRQLAAVTGSALTAADSDGWHAADADADAEIEADADVDVDVDVDVDAAASASAVAGANANENAAAPMTALAAALIAQGRLQGRVGWRATAVDRLPLVGAVPMQPPFGTAAALPDQPRHWPRVPGLFVATGLGSRGLTWAPLVGRLIASWITGAPFPLPADLVDALDPARFAARAVRASRRPVDKP